MKILIVGNGSTAVDRESKEHYITKNTGEFLKALDNKIQPVFLQFNSVYDKDSNLLDFGLKQNNLKSEIFYNKLNPICYFKLILLILKMDKIYLFYPGTLSRLVGLIGILLNKPIGLYIRGQYYNQDILDSFILKRTKFIFTISPSFAKELRSYCSKIEIIKPMINIKVKDFKKDRNYNVNNKWNFLFVGRVEERKGIYELLQIAKQLKDKNFSFCLNIVGGGDLLIETNKRLNELNLTNEVVLHGLISSKKALRALYNEANVFVFPSHDEGFPRVLYEAMASGLPIFTTFVGGISGRMEHLKNCIKLPVKQPYEAGSIICSYLKEPNVLKEVGVNGQKTLEKIIDGSLLPHENLLTEQLGINWMKTKSQKSF